MSEGETNTTNNSFKKSTKPKKTKHSNSLANNNNNCNNTFEVDGSEQRTESSSPQPRLDAVRPKIESIAT